MCSRAFPSCTNADTALEYTTQIGMVLLSFRGGKRGDRENRVRGKVEKVGRGSDVVKARTCVRERVNLIINPSNLLSLRIRLQGKIDLSRQSSDSEKYYSYYINIYNI